MLYFSLICALGTVFFLPVISSHLYFHAGQLLNDCCSEALGKFGTGVVSLPVKTRASAGAMWLGRRDGRGKHGWTCAFCLPGKGCVDCFD